MIEITAEIRAFIDKAAAGVELAEDEYIDPSDGLIHCKKCGGQRQTVVPCFGKSGYFMPRCICQCQREAEEQRKAAEERQRRMERIKRRKAQGLQDRYLYDYTFSNDNRQNPLMDKGVFVTDAPNGFENIRAVLAEYVHRAEKKQQDMTEHEKCLTNGTYERARESGTEQNYDMIDGCVNNVPKKPRRIGGRWSVLDRLHIKQAQRKQKDQTQQQQQERSRKN